MAGTSMLSRTIFGINVGLLVAVLGASMTYQNAQAILGIDIGAIIFNVTLKTAKFSTKMALKSLMARPKIVAVILSILFYKEILCFAKDFGGYVAGEFPEISFAAGLCALFYVFSNFTPEEETPS